MTTPPGSDSPPTPLSRFRARMAQTVGRERIEALLGADDPHAAVAALSATELYQTIAEIGLADAIELVALATPEQFRGCLDIEVWDRDQLQVEAVGPWLAALLEAGPDHVGRVWETLDSELTALTLQRLVRIYDLSLGEEPDDPDNPALLETPDTFFAVALPDDEPTAALVHGLLDALYRTDPSGALARHTLMAARTEPPAELEEMSYRWRAGRMADLGYAEFYDALEVFRPLDPQRVEIGEDTADRFPPGGEDEADQAAQVGLLPAAMAQSVAGTSFLARALDAIDDPAELARLETALVVLVNKVLAAARVSPGDAEAVRAGARHAAATCALGLEAISQGALDAAVAALGSVSLTRLHRLGHTLALRLARMGRALAPRAAMASGPDAAMLAALLGPRPWFPTVLDRADDSAGARTQNASAGIGESERAGSAVRPFESLDDLRRVAEALTRLALRVAVVDAMGVDLIAAAGMPEPRPALDDYLRTGLVWSALGESFRAAPLKPDDIVRLLRQGFADGKLTAAARVAAAAGLDRLLAQAQVSAGQQLVPGLKAALLDDLDQRLGGLSPERPPESRFVTGLVWG